ncbi:hypothetical protein GLS40_07900 [Pseudooceanicola sp. 216_PA32_1]|uniref:Lysozyme n=1 Tax=Pseudooceanicola pacificus TaxID=2676438 RepID=A0A844W552_9RHOB|nr:lysozyme [Pseudooceanicola pacificus]MWB77941.1 hypothetical protein [Pseudooceanicola pacificus]
MITFASQGRKVNGAIKVPLRPHRFDALVSFDLNAGGIFRALLTKAINSGDLSGDGVRGWLEPKSIIDRREDEQALFRTGNYDANGDKIAIWRVDENGRLRGIERTITGRKLRALMAHAGSRRKVATDRPGGLAAFFAALANCLRFNPA